VYYTLSVCARTHPYTHTRMKEIDFEWKKNLICGIYNAHCTAYLTFQPYIIIIIIIIIILSLLFAFYNPAQFYSDVVKNRFMCNSRHTTQTAPCKRT
jgi:hypothetical protein